jgi:hypothetical protein
MAQPGAFSLRLGDRCAWSHRIDRMLATAPKSGPALVHSRVLRHDGRAPRPHQPRVESPREASRDLQPAVSAQPIDHQPELASLN